MIHTKVENAKADHLLMSITPLVDTSISPYNGLLSGNLGRALYYFYSYKHFSDIEQLQNGLSIINTLFQELLNSQSKFARNISLSSGLAGFGWSLHTLYKEQLIDFSIESILAVIDQKIMQVLIHQIQHDNLDFLHSAIGAIAYLADRYEGQLNLREPLELYVHALHDKVRSYEKKGGFIKNLYSYSRYNDSHIDNVNLSLSHGYCAILLTLMHLYEKNIAKNIMGEMIETGVNFIMNSLKEENLSNIMCSVFPSNIVVSLPKEHKQNLAYYNQRIGWCYGDLNQVLLLYKAGKLLKRADWIKLADKVGAFTLSKKDSHSTQIDDMYLCHGTSGVSLFYHTLYKISGNVSYLDGAGYWMDKTIDTLEETLSVPGKAKGAYGFLEGLAGVGLAIMSFLNDSNDGWRKFLYLSY